MKPESRIPWHRSIRLKLVVVAIAVEVAMLALLLANSYRLLNQALVAQTAARMDALTPLLNASLANPVFQRDHTEIEQIIGRLVESQLSDIPYLAVYDPKGRLLAHAGRFDPAHAPGLDAGVGEALRDLVYDAQVTLTVRTTTVGSARFGLSLTSMLLVRDDVVRQGVVIAVIEILLSLVLLTSGGYLITRHVTPLLAATRRISGGDYAARIAPGSADELGELADDFNAMAAMIEERISALSESESRFREIFEAVGEAIFIHEAETGRVIDVNRRMLEMYRCSREQALRATPELFSANTPPFTAAEALDRIRRAVAEGPQTFEWLARDIEGRIFWVEVNLRHARIGSHDRLIAVVRDIEERKYHQSALEHLAHHDPLTQLPNRILLADRLEQALAQAQRGEKLLVVAYLDLDGFKPVNDNLGHDVGDSLLIEVAGRLRACVRAGDTVARLGGDEFVLLLGGLASIDECTVALDRILATIASPYPDHAGIEISASIGVTAYPLDDGDADTLIRHADQAMYAAKQAGRNRYHLFDPHQDQRARAFHEAVAEMTEVLARREFTLHYQPKVNLRRGTVLGAEALIRWQHPERGLLPPAQFLPLIEDSEFAATLSKWVLETAVAQAAAWHRAGLALTVGINVAARHLQSKHFIDDVRAALAAHPELPHGRIELEVLETTALEDIAAVAKVIEAGHALGVHFALDDFGTGYSSLTYFKRLRVDTLKIDRSFVIDMLDDREDAAIVEGIVGLTRVFRRNVVAEGVETTAHGAALLAMGCDVVQGYGIARPMPADALPAWVADYQRGGAAN
jgi:diguanylate cyclase (GGDEF)-like protein/PAS domain S-box-containing protein